MMISRDDTTETTTTTEQFERLSRTATRREIINEKRHRQTDFLPRINGDTSGGKFALRQVTQLREENKRLRWDLEDMQRLLSEYKEAQAQFESEIANIQRSHQMEIEQYQQNLREMMEERNQMQEANSQLEQRYQELYHSFHEKVEEEAHKMVSEAARTLVLAPEHTPPLLHDVVKTLEFQVKQTEDQHVAEILTLMRQAQRKAQQLEQEMAFERTKIAEERQNLASLQKSVSEQAQLRYKVLRSHLESRWVARLTFMTTVLLLLLPIFQLTFLSFGLPLYISLFLPVVIGFVISIYLARMHTASSAYHASKHDKPKPGDKAASKPAGKAATKKL